MAQRRVTTSLTFISAGETTATRRSAFPNDDPLTERAERKVAALAWRPPAGARTLCAPGQAARRTADALGLVVKVGDGLREVDYGRWTGLRLKSLSETEPEALALWLSDPGAAPHGGESIGCFIERISAWLADRRASEGATFVVASPSAVKAAVTAALEAPALSYWRIDVPPLSATELVGDGAGWKLRSLGGPLT